MNGDASPDLAAGSYFGADTGVMVGACIPKLAIHVEVAEDGAPRVVDVTGHDTFNAPVSEHLTARGAALAWNNGAEIGEAPSTSGAVYTPLYGSSALWATVARALLRAPDHTRALLPAGRGQIERGRDLVVEGEGGKLHVTLYQLLGFDYAPVAIWLDDEGQLFARGSEWQVEVRSGYRSALPRLFAEQESARLSRLGDLAKRVTHRPPPAGLAIVHARIVDVEAKTTLMGTIVVKGDRIVAVGPEATTPVPPGAQTIDAAGKTVIPGLWDMHAHVDASDGLLDMAAGVTTVRDLANDMDVVDHLRKNWDSGETIGPRLILAERVRGVLHRPQGCSAGASRAHRGSPARDVAPRLHGRWTGCAGGPGRDLQSLVHADAGDDQAPVRGAAARGAAVSSQSPTNRPGEQASPTVSRSFDTVEPGRSSALARGGGPCGRVGRDPPFQERHASWKRPPPPLFS